MSGDDQIVAAGAKRTRNEDAISAEREGSLPRESACRRGREGSAKAKVRLYLWYEQVEEAKASVDVTERIYHRLCQPMVAAR